METRRGLISDHLLRYLLYIFLAVLTVFILVTVALPMINKIGA